LVWVHGEANGLDEIDDYDIPVTILLGRLLAE
jgi:hypothetical protein